MRFTDLNQLLGEQLLLQLGERRVYLCGIKFAGQRKFFCGELDMKWFKHFSNAHKGTILQDLYLEFGVNEGHGLYFRFVEYLTDKWDGCGEPRFKILTSELRQFLKLTSPRLHRLATIVQLSDNSEFKVAEDFCNIFLPKLLEIRHRDALAADLRPEIGRPKNGQEKNKRKNKNNTKGVFDLELYESLVAEFKEKFGSTEGPAKTRFTAQIKTPEDLADLKASFQNYRRVLDVQTWRAAKTTFAIYLGTEKSGYFWRDYIKPIALVDQNRSTICGIVP